MLFVFMEITYSKGFQGVSPDISVETPIPPCFLTALAVTYLYLATNVALMAGGRGFYRYVTANAVQQHGIILTAMVKRRNKRKKICWNQGNKKASGEGGFMMKGTLAIFLFNPIL
jgi:hypothetical protein